MLASVQAVDEKLGHRYRKISSAADDPIIPRAAYVSPEAIGGAEGGLIGVLMYVGAMAAAGAVVASGGTLAAAIIGAALSGGVGGLVGSLLAEWLGEEHGRHLQEQVERGGLLLWVRTWDRADEKRAMEILKKHSGSHVHVHSLPVQVRPQAAAPARSLPERAAPVVHHDLARPDREPPCARDGAIGRAGHPAARRHCCGLRRVRRTRG